MIKNLLFKLLVLGLYYSNNCKGDIDFAIAIE